MECSKRGKMAKVTGNALLLKPGLSTSDKVTFKVLGMEANGIKSQKTWSKKRGIESSCDALVRVAGGVDVPLEMAARIVLVANVSILLISRHHGIRSRRVIWGAINCADLTQYKKIWRSAAISPFTGTWYWSVAQRHLTSSTILCSAT